MCRDLHAMQLKMCIFKFVGGPCLLGMSPAQELCCGLFHYIARKFVSGFPEFLRSVLDSHRKTYPSHEFVKLWGTGALMRPDLDCNS